MEIARSLKMNPAKVERVLKKSVDKIDSYCYNRDRYLAMFGHLFDEFAKNVKRVHPKKCYDEEWGLTHQEVWLLKLWKIDGVNTKTIMKRMRLSEASVNQYKTRIAQKVGIDGIGRRKADTTRIDSHKFCDYELSAF